MSDLEPGRWSTHDVPAASGVQRTSVHDPPLRQQHSGEPEWEHVRRQCLGSPTSFRGDSADAITCSTGRPTPPSSTSEQIAKSGGS